MYDIAIIGAGVIGCSLARELSRYDINIVLIEKDEDVSCGTSKANSGIVHGGYAAKHGTGKARFCAAGNAKYDKLEAELNFGFRRTGSLVLAFSPEELQLLETIKSNGIQNGVSNLEIWPSGKIMEREPHINSKVKAALHCPSAGVTSPYEQTIALAENALANGVKLLLKNEIIQIIKESGHFILEGTAGTIRSRQLINAAGVGSDTLTAMIERPDFRIIPRKGQYLVFEKDYGSLVKQVIFQVPSAAGKGILVTPTYHNNLMIGPDASEIPVKYETGTDLVSLKDIVRQARKSVPEFETRRIIRSFSGIRATPDTHDFIVGSGKTRGFYQAAGIESPGLTSSPAIAEHLSQMIVNDFGFKMKDDFKPERRAIIKYHEKLPPRELKRRIELSSGAERIVCRCEQVTEEEIIDSLNRGIAVTTLDGVKRRTRAGMGRCQGKFCSPRVKEIIAKEYNMGTEEISPRGTVSGDLPERPDVAELRKLDQN